VPLVLSAWGVVLSAGAFVWNELHRDALRAYPIEPGLAVEEVDSFEYLPVRIATDEWGRVFVSFDRSSNGQEYGGVWELVPDRETGRMTHRIVAQSALLYRPYGLAARGGDLFVSHSGRFARARGGQISYESTGAVTRLSDADGDHTYEFYDDVVTGLPGSRGPDSQHQNNGVCFGPDGALYVANGVSSNRDPGEHPWEGTILRTDPASGAVEVFARGFRNPFALAFGPGGALFATDNDVDQDPGDELNHVVRGAHYGHPYVIPGADTRATGFTPPVHLGGPGSNLLGLAYTEATALPERFRGCLYVADPNRGQVLRLRLERRGATFAVVAATPFAAVPSPVDIAVTRDGVFYVLSRFSRKVFRVRCVEGDGEEAHRGQSPRRLGELL
jgi:glucose/arabinose dehydrogenase